MVRERFYIQCRLTRYTANGELEDVVWVPEEYAVPSREIEVRKRGEDRWNRWFVKEAYIGIRRAESLLIEKERGYLCWRKVTDV